MSTEMSRELEAPRPIGRINPVFPRSRPPNSAALSARVVRLAHWLEPADRGLVQSVYRDGVSIDAAAAVLAITPHAARRRVHRLWVRLIDPEFAWVVERLHGWEHTRRAVAMARVVHGLSLRHAAQRLGLSMHAVRLHTAAIHAAYELDSAQSVEQEAGIRRAV